MRNTYGRLVRIVIPETSFKELEEERKKYERLVSDYDATALRVGELRAKLEQARDEHLNSRADAISNGKKEPDDAALCQLAEELADAEERLKVVELALDRTGDAVLDLAARKKGEWLAEQEKAKEEAREAYRDAIRVMAAARAELGREVGFANWLRRFEQKPMAGPSSTPKMFQVGNGPDDRPLGHDELVALLLADAEPPAPPTQRVMFAPQTWPAMGVPVGRGDV
jgi:hypothetical protein